MHVAYIPMSYLNSVILWIYSIVSRHHGRPTIYGIMYHCGIVTLKCHNLTLFVQWLKLHACLENQRSRVRIPLWPSCFKETKCFILAHVHDREVVCLASDRQFSNPVSGGQCHLIHITTLRRFS